MRMGVGTHDCVEAAPAVIRQTSASSSDDVPEETRDVRSA
jgi:hypothetical protein